MPVIKQGIALQKLSAKNHRPFSKEARARLAVSFPLGCSFLLGACLGGSLLLCCGGLLGGGLLGGGLLDASLWLSNGLGLLGGLCLLGSLGLLHTRFRGWKIRFFTKSFWDNDGTSGHGC